MIKKYFSFLLAFLFSSIALSAPVPPQNGGTGVSNDNASTLTINGAHPSTFNITGDTNVTFPTSGTLATTGEVGIATLQDAYDNGTDGALGSILLNSNNLNPIATFNTNFLLDQIHYALVNYVDPNTNTPSPWGIDYRAVISNGNIKSFVRIEAISQTQLSSSENAALYVITKSYGADVTALKIDGQNQSISSAWPMNIPNGAQVFQSTHYVTSDLSYDGTQIGTVFVSDDVADHTATIPASYFSTNADDSFSVQTRAVHSITLSPTGGATINGSSSDFVIPANYRAVAQLVNPTSKAWVVTLQSPLVATSANTFSTIVARDSSGNFSGGTFSGILDGYLAINSTSVNANIYPILSSTSSGNNSPFVSTNYSLNPSTGVLSVTGAHLSGLTASSLVATDASKNLVSTNLTGDVTSSAATTTLATVNSNVGTFGDGTHSSQVTVNAKGLVTAASSVAITGAAPTGAASGDLTGSYPSPTLATVNSNVGSWGTASSVSTITVNAKGLTIAAANTPIQISESQVTNLTTDLNSKLNLSGGTMTGDLILNADPTSSSQAVTKNYVDSIAAGFNQFAVVAASTANLTGTYNNVSSGLGATFTLTATGAFSLDGQSGILNSQYLLKDQTSSLENGIYKLTTIGDVSTQAVLTRSIDYDTPAQITPSDIINVAVGSVNGGISYLQNATVATIGLDAISFSRWGGQSMSYVGDVSGSGFSPVTLSIGSAKVSNAMLAGSIDSSKLIGSDITTVGTITSGTWSGSFGAVSGANLTSLTAANISAGTAGINISGNSATVTTNANLTGDVTSVGNAATVVKINGATLGTTTATSGNVLIGSGTVWDTHALGGDITMNLLGTTTIGTNKVTFAKFQQVGASNLVGNATGSLANATGISLGSTLTFSGAALQTLAITGDVTSSANSFSTTLTDNAVTLAKMAQMSTASFLGRNTASTGNVEVLSEATAKTMLNLTGTNSGDVTLAGQNYLSISSQVITANAVDLSGTNATGILAAARFPALTGDVTTSSGAVATTLAANIVTYAKFQQVAASSLVGNATGSLANATGITLGTSLAFSGSSLNTVQGIQTSDSPTFAGQTSSGTGTVVNTIASTTSGSFNEAALNIVRKDQANGYAQTYYKTDTTSVWQTGLRVNDANYHILDAVNGVHQLIISQGATNTGVATFAGSVNVGSDLVVATAGKTVKIKTGSNACMGTGAVLSSGSVAVSTTCAATGDVIMLTKTAASGTEGFVRYSISNGVSFTITSSSGSDVSTYSWVIFKAAP
jgi:hypothetical protein